MIVFLLASSFLVLKPFRNAMRGLSFQKCPQIAFGLFLKSLMYKSLLCAEQVVNSGELSILLNPGFENVMMKNDYNKPNQTIHEAVDIS